MFLSTSDHLLPDCAKMVFFASRSKSITCDSYSSDSSNTLPNQIAWFANHSSRCRIISSCSLTIIVRAIERRSAGVNEPPMASPGRRFNVLVGSTRCLGFTYAGLNFDNFAPFDAITLPLIIGDTNGANTTSVSISSNAISWVSNVISCGKNSARKIGLNRCSLRVRKPSSVTVSVIPTGIINPFKKGR